MQATLCISCNAPAPEFDDYQALSAEVMSTITQAVTIIRITNEGSDAGKKRLPETAATWMDRAMADLHRGNDLREIFADTNRSTVHRECDAWKVTYRRLNALLVELDYVRRSLIGAMYPRLLR